MYLGLVQMNPGQAKFSFWGFFSIISLQNYEIKGDTDITDNLLKMTVLNFQVYTLHTNIPFKS